jgi:hypothetical protein
VDYSRKWNDRPKTVFTNVPIPEEQRVGAKEAIVVERLYDGQTLVLRRVRDRRAEQGKRVVHVHQIWPVSLAKAPELPVYVSIPNRILCQAQSAQACHSIVGRRVPVDQMTMALQEVRLCSEHTVFPTRLPVVVMD